MEKHLSHFSKLKHERQLRGWSQADVANMIGGDPRTISRWERGITSPSPSLLRKLVEIFGKNAEELGLMDNQTHRDTRPGELPHPFPRREDWGEAPHIQSFCGREQELAALEQWILDEQCRMVIVLGLGGVGKTTLASTLAERIKDEFQYVFWRSLQHAPPLKVFLERCILFLAGQELSDLPRNIDELLLLLLTYLRTRRSLLILDNFESVLQGGDQTGQYQAGYADYEKLLQRMGETEHQSCLLLTSREQPGQFPRLAGAASPVRSMQLSGVGQAEGQKILANASLFGSDQAWASLVRLYAGNPLALKLISAPIHEVFGGDIAGFLQGEEAVFGEIYDLLNQQFHRLSALEQEVMYWLAIEREAISLHEIRDNMRPRAAKGALVEALHSLRRRSMLETNAHNLFTLQPVIMEYVTERFIKMVAREIEMESLQLLSRHALLKALAKDYVRNSQVRFILAPLAANLLATYGKAESEKKLYRMLSTLRDTHFTSYAAGNILNLLIQLQANLRGSDFSHLLIQQAYLQGIALPEVNFAHSHFTSPVFTDTFGSVLCVAFSPTGNLLAAGTADGEIRLWQAANGAALLTCQGHTDGVRSLTFNLDGNLLISGSEDHTVRFWDVHSGHCLKVLHGHSSVVRSVAFGSHKNIVASGSEDQTIRLWDINTGHCLGILRGHTHWVRAVVFSPASHSIASGSNDHTIRIWDIDTGRCVHILQGHSGPVRSVAFSSDGSALASGGDDEVVRLWDTSTGHCLKVFQGHAYPIRSVVFSPDSRLIASGGDDQIVRLWDVSTGQCLNMLQEHTNRIWSVAFSPNSQLLASGSEDQTVRFWDVHTGHCLQTLQGYSSLVWSVAFSPAGRLIASTGDDQFVRLWDCDTGQCLNILQGHVNRVRTVAFSLDGRLLASGSDDQTIRLWDISTAQCLSILRSHNHLVSSVAFSPTGTTLVSGSYDQTVRLWDVSTAQCIKTLQGGNALIWSVAFSADGRFVASSSDKHAVQVWDISTGSTYNRLRGHLDQVWCVAFSPGGNIAASGSDDQSIRLWDINTGRCLKTLQGHSHWVRTLAFSPDGRTLASGSHDQTVRLWDINLGQRLKTLRGHSSWIWSVAFSPDGRLVASGSDDGTINLWNVQTGECLKTLRSERPYEGMNITAVKGLTEAQKITLRALGAIEIFPTL